MKFEVIGWTNYEDETYPEHREDFGAVDYAVEEAIRRGGFRFGGDSHQAGETCTPVLNDGTRALFSFREWGYIMAEALDLRTEKGLDYMEWYMDIEKTLIDGEELVYPPAGVEKSKIKARAELAETFPFAVSPAEFEAVVSGKKRVELCTKEGGLERVCRDDFLLYTCGERTCRVQVSEVESFESFSALFGNAEEQTESELARRKNLVNCALYEGCDPAALHRTLAERYPSGESELYSVAAFTFTSVPERAGKGEKR